MYDIGWEGGQPYLILPVLPGGDVEGVIEDAPDHKLSIEQAVKIATETCRAWSSVTPRASSTAISSRGTCGWRRTGGR